MVGMLCSGVDFNHLSCTIGLVTAYFKKEKLLEKSAVDF